VPGPDSAAKIASRGRFALALAVVLAVAAALRLGGLDWDEGRYLHPDERFLAQVESALERPSSFREYLDTHRSPLNPNARGFGFYVYGTLPLFAVHGLGNWLGAPGNDLDRNILGIEVSAEYASVYLVGRGLSVLCDLVTTLLVFAIGARLYGRRSGLLASALYAVAVLPIQQAHFFTVDAMTTMWATAALWAATGVAQRGRWSDDLLFGIALGAALACKVSLFPVAALIGIAAVLRFALQRDELSSSGAAGEPFRRQVATLAVRGAISVSAAILVAIVAFRLLQPYAFVPPYSGPAPDTMSQRVTEDILNVVAPRLNPAWIDQMSRANRQQIGDDDSPPNHQWASRTALVFPWLNMVRFGLGWPLGLAAWLGWAWALVEVLRGRSQGWRHVLPVAWVGLYFSWTGSGWVTSMRYFLPIYPPLMVLAAWFLSRLAVLERNPSVSDEIRPPHLRRLLGSAAIAVVLLGSAAWAAAFTGVYRRPHSRIAASRWIYSHLVSGAAIAHEGSWDDAVPMPLPGLEPNERFTLYALEMVWEDDVAKRQRLQDILDRVDYLSISSNRFYDSLSRNPRRWPMTLAYYRALFDGSLGFELVADFTVAPSLGPLTIDDQPAEEAFTVYDHPRVMIFRKTEAYDPEQTTRILGRADLDSVLRRPAREVTEPPVVLRPPPPL
jgi:hypothetical protein